MSVTDWSSIQSTIHAWLVAGSGLSASKVRWAGQPYDRAAYPFVLVRLSGIEPGPMMTYRSYDAVDDEVDVTYAGQDLATFTVEAFADGMTLGSHALSYIDDCIAELYDQARREAFMTANVGFVRVANVVDLSGPLEGRMISRWATDVQFYVPKGTTATESYIDTVGITGTLSDGVSDTNVEI